MNRNLCQNAIRFVFLTFCFCGLLVATVSAQSINGKILGTVTDQNSAVVPNATVNAINEGTGAKRTVNADESGFYVIPELPVGFYTVEISSGSFALFTLKNVKVDVGGETRTDASLGAQGVTTTVDVTDDSALLKTDSSSLSEVISSRQVDSLPINGRDFRRLITLTPGAAPRSQRGSLGSFTVNGQREKANIFLIDGVDNNDSFRNQPSFNQGGVTGAPATLIPVDALGELSLQTQGAAEYGRNSGAVVNIVIKSGANAFHGAGYGFIRNDNFDARNFFEQQKNEFRNGNFGGVVGGPIWKNRTFFFTGYEGQREFVNSPFVVRVPSAADIAAARLENSTAGRPENALSTRLLGLFPTANLNVTTGNNYAFAAPNLNNSNNFLVKIDHRFTDNFNVSGRYIYGKGTQNFPLTSGNGSPLPPYQTVVPTKIQLFGFNFSNVITPRLFNEARIGYNRFEQTFTPLDAAFDPASLGLVTGSGLKSLPTITVTGFVSLGAPTNVPRGRVSSAFQLVDNVTWTRGSHSFKFGGEYRRAIVDSFADQNARGRINFAATPASVPPNPPVPAFGALANFLAGVVATSGTTLLRGTTRRETFTNNFGFFAQDDWKVTSRLSLNLGLRYEYLGVLQEKQKRLSNFLFDRGLVRVGDAGLPSVWKPDRNNFGPRLGFAYDAFGRGKTIVRGSFGVFYDTPSQDYFLLQSFENGGPGSLGSNPLPGLDVFTVTPTAPVPFGPGITIFPTGGFPTSNIPLFATDINQRTPYIFNYNVNVQQQLFKNTVLQVSYVGSQGHRLYRVRDINQATPGPAATRQSRRPLNTRFPQYSFINYLEASANSHYNAFQTYLRQRLTSGLNLYISYTLSRSIDDASNGIYGGTRGVSYPQDSNNLRAERAVSSFDVRHRFSLNFVYDVNFLADKFGKNRLTEGWQLSGILTSSSGIPITAFLADDVSGTGERNDRPDQTGNPNSGPRTAGQFFNTAAFSIPTLGTFGNAPRNSIIGPRFNVLDLSLNKTTRITERVSLQFRAEAFNIFNHTNFSLPNVNRNSPAFGAISETPDVTAGNPRLGEGGPRVLQFGLKLIF